MHVSSALKEGDVVDGDFTVESALAEGGMGSVYVARQNSTGKRRALKVMHPAIVADEALRRRFEREAKVGASIDSDHVVEVIAAGVDEARRLPYLVMELLEGEDLRARLERRGPLARDELRAVFEQLCHAVGAAHAAGIVHRDLKPENVFLARSRRADAGPVSVKVLDFGIAKFLAEADTRLTRGSVGSPQWMAPEQTSPGAVTAEADVWALGLVAYELVTGGSFWKTASGSGGTAAQLLREIVLDPIPPASARATEQGVAERLPEGFDAWFARCVAREPSARFKDATLAWRSLARVLDGEDTALADTREATAEATPFSPSGNLASAPPAIAVSEPPFVAASPPPAPRAEPAPIDAGPARRDATDATPPPASRRDTPAPAPQRAGARSAWIVAGAIVVAGLAIAFGVSRRSDPPLPSAVEPPPPSAAAPPSTTASATPTPTATASATATATSAPSAHPTASSIPTATPAHTAPLTPSAPAPPKAPRGPAPGVTWKMKDGRHVRLLARIASNGSNVTDEVVKSAIEWNAWQYLRCYEKAFGTLKDQPEGVIVVDYEILDQLPRRAKLRSSTFHNAAIDQCVVGTLVGQTINAAGPNGAGPASHAFRFVPSE